MAGIICPNCLSPNDDSTLTCRNCNGSLSTLEAALVEKRDFQGYIILERLPKHDSQSGFAYLAHKKDAPGETLAIRDTKLFAVDKAELRKEVDAIRQQTPQSKLVAVSEGHCYTVEPLIEEAEHQEETLAELEPKQPEEVLAAPPEPCPSPRCNGTIAPESGICLLCHTQRGAKGEDIWLRTVVRPALETDYAQAARAKTSLLDCAGEFGLTTALAEEKFDEEFKQQTGGLSLADYVSTEPVAEKESSDPVVEIETAEIAARVQPGRESAAPEIADPTIAAVAEQPSETPGNTASRLEPASAPAAIVEQATAPPDRIQASARAAHTAPSAEVKKVIEAPSEPLREAAIPTPSPKRTRQIPVGRLVIGLVLVGVLGFVAYFIWLLRPAERTHIPLHPSDAIYRKEIKDFQAELKNRICQKVADAQSKGSFTEASRIGIQAQIVKEKGELERVSKLSVELPNDDISRLIKLCEGKP